MGNQHPNITPYETFPTADGEIAVAVGSERQWVRFCATHRATHPGRRIRASPNNAARLAHRGELRTLLDVGLRPRPDARRGWPG